MSLTGGPILRGSAIKNMAVGRDLLLEETLVDELCDCRRNFRSPVPNAGVEHPPTKDALHRILCIWMPGKISQNFWRGRWERGVGWHTLEQSRALFSSRCATSFQLLRERLNLVRYDSLGPRLLPLKTPRGCCDIFFARKTRWRQVLSTSWDNFIPLFDACCGVDTCQLSGLAGNDIFVQLFGAVLSSRTRAAEVSGEQNSAPLLINCAAQMMIEA
jgi:hypothetical protein